jgi:hypothetical protein
LNIPARYTFGYFPDIAVEPPDVAMDFHAWFEAYLGGRWYTFDARHNVPRIGRVKIAHGRDAVDVALSTSYGAAALTSMVVWSDEIPDEEAEAGPELLNRATLTPHVPQHPPGAGGVTVSHPSPQEQQSALGRGTVSSETVLVSAGAPLVGPSADNDEDSADADIASMQARG